MPPTGFRTGISGLCPLIINGVKFGIGNTYAAEAPAGAPLTGEPDSKFKPYLTQRNNNKYAALSKVSPRSGKVGFGVTKAGVGYIIAQAHGATPGATMDELRDTFIGLDCYNALAADGSDSVIMYRKETDGTLKLVCQPGILKDRSMTIGFAFKGQYNKPLPNNK